MEMNVKVIDSVCEIEQPLRTLLHGQQLNWRRQVVGHPFTQHALRGDERRVGKTAKLIDLSARLKGRAL
jgi:hypothetical protein